MAANRFCCRSSFLLSAAAWFRCFSTAPPLRGSDFLIGRPILYLLRSFSLQQSSIGAGAVHFSGVLPVTDLSQICSCLDSSRGSGAAIFGLRYLLAAQTETPLPVGVLSFFLIRFSPGWVSPPRILLRAGSRATLNIPFTVFRLLSEFLSRFLSEYPSRIKSLLMLPENLSLRTPEISPRREVACQLFDGMQERDSLQSCRERQIQKPSESFQICITLLSGKTLLLWVSSSDFVHDLKQQLNLRVGIPAASQRLLFKGKELEDLFPLSVYNIQRNAAIILSLRLRRGAAGQSSSAAAFSYRDAVHAQKPKNAAPPVQGPKPFLVDKMEETPSIEIVHPSMDRQFQLYAEKGIICRFNGLWPRTMDSLQLDQQLQGSSLF